MIDDVELSELLAVKLCHDLSGPVGAVNNGIELLREGEGEFYDQAVDLADSSAKDAVARILFYRQAYGSANRESLVNPLFIQELSTNFFMSSKVNFTWGDALLDAENARLINGYVSKIILNLTLFVSKSLIHGGNVKIDIESDGDKCKILIRGEGKSVKFDPESEVILLGSGEEKLPVSVKNVQSYFISRILERAGMELDISNGDDYIEIIAI